MRRFQSRVETETLLKEIFVGHVEDIRGALREDIPKRILFENMKTCTETDIRKVAVQIFGKGQTSPYDIKTKSKINASKILYAAHYCYAKS